MIAVLVRESAAPPESRPGPAVSGAPTFADPPVAAAPAAPAADETYELAAEPPAEVELPWELEEIARRYRAAPGAEERTDALLELGLSDDPRALAFLLAELERATPEQRESVISGVVQFGSRDAVPRLRALAQQARTPAERRALDDAADYLELPSLAELRSGEASP